MRCLRHLKAATQIRARFGSFARADVFDFTLTDHRAALRTGSRSHIHHPVGRTNHLGVMLNHDDRVAGLREFLEHLNDASRIALMQANRRLIEHIGHARQTGAKLPGQTNALNFAARKA